MSPRNERRNQQIKDERQEQILDAALKVFATSGFTATKISDIANAAGVSHGLVYHYFSSKEQIFNELVGLAVDGSVGTLAQVDQLPMQPINKVRAITEFILKGIADTEETAYYFLLMVQARISRLEGTPYYTQDDLPAGILAKIIAQGQEIGQIKEGDPFDMAGVYFAAIMGIAINRALEEQFSIPSPEILIGMLAK